MRLQRTKPTAVTAVSSANKWAGSGNNTASLNRFQQTHAQHQRDGGHIEEAAAGPSILTADPTRFTNRTSLGFNRAV